MLYNVTGKKNTIQRLLRCTISLKNNPVLQKVVFGIKKYTKEQMWLDGLYMAESFYAEYAAQFHHEADFDDIAKQFILMEQHARDPKTGLLYHGWDYSKKQKWANAQTGLSPNFWARADGWYAMALVDVLDYLPQDYTKRADIIAILNRLATAIQKYQDPKSGVLV